MRIFGDIRTDANSLRHNSNVLTVTGIEADYDGGAMPFEEAVTLVTEAGLQALVYTSPSHTPEVPRWRVLCPFSTELPPEQRTRMLARLNGLFDGIFAGESWTLSQAYYFGSVNRNPAHQAVVIDGTPIDQFDLLDSIAVGKTSPSLEQSQGPELTPTVIRTVVVANDSLSHKRIGIQIDIALQKVRNSPDGKKHPTLRAQARVIGGWLHHFGTSDDEAVRWLLDALNGRAENEALAEKTARWGLAEGRKEPLELEDRLNPKGGQLAQLALEPPPYPGPPDTDRSATPMQSARVADEVVYDTGLEFDADEWDEAALPTRPWVSPGYLLRQAVTVLVGAGAAGKSSLMIAWTVALARNQSFHRMTPRHACRVLIFNAEDGPDEQKLRFSAALRSFGATPADLKDVVLRVSTTKLGRLLGPVDGVIGFLPAMQKLEQQIAEFKPDVVMLDPMIELHAADENDNGGIREVMSHFRTLAVRYNLALVLAHHTRKGAIIPGDPDGARGASAIVGAARIVMTAVTMSEPEAEAFGISEKTRKSYFRLDGAKSNHAALQEAEWFEKVAHQLANGEWAVTVAPWDAPEDVIDLDTRTAIIAGAEQGSPEGPWSPKMTNDGRSIRQLFARHGVTTKKGQTAFLNEMTASLGFTVETFRKPTDRKPAQGIRSKNGRPDTVRWVSDEETP